MVDAVGVMVAGARGLLHQPGFHPIVRAGPTAAARLLPIVAAAFTYRCKNARSRKSRSVRDWAQTRSPGHAIASSAASASIQPPPGRLQAVVGQTCISIGDLSAMW